MFSGSLVVLSGFYVVVFMLYFFGGVYVVLFSDFLVAFIGS